LPFPLVFFTPFHRGDPPPHSKDQTVEQATGPVILVGLIVLGFALFWARHLVYRHRPAAADDAVKLMLSLAAWICIVVGLSGVVLQGLFVFSPVGLAIVAGVAIMLVTRYRALERRSLLRCLSIAAQKGVPLNEATRAFANERSDELGLRATRLAEAIEAGMSLPAALVHSGTRLPLDALLAVRVGYETGTLSESLRRIARVDSDLDLLVRSVYEKLMYLLWIWLVMFGLLTFIMLKIVPVFEKMFREFELELPSATQWLVHFSMIFAQYWFLGAPVFVGLLVIACMGALYYVDLLPRGAPLVHWFSRRWDGALIMRVLAMAVGNSWPMNKTVWLLSRIYPTGPVRGRLVTAGNQIDNGSSWSDSLLKVGLLRNPDWSVLQAANRVGNLEWALDEMADSSLRRLVYMMRLAVNVAFPVTLFFFGLVVGYVVVSLFVPLVSLIQGLS
jgi:type IV pilus assembly protein PilC